MKLIILLTAILFSFGVHAETITLKKGNFIKLSQAFNANTTAQVKYDFMLLPKPSGLKFDPNQKGPVYLVLDTPGGSIMDGLSMIDFLLASGREIKTVSIFAASMGFQTVQALGERIITPSGVLMAHKARGGFQGEFGDGTAQLDQRYDFWMRKLTRLDKKAVERTKGKHTLDSYRKLFENEYWCEGQDCVEQGFADKVAGVTCDSSLKGVQQKHISLSFMGIRIEVEYKLPDCPLISALDVKVSMKKEDKKSMVSIYSPEVPENLRNQILGKIDPTNKFKNSVKY